MLVLVEYLVEAVHGEEGDPRDVQLGDNLVSDGCLAAGGSSTDPDDEGFNLLSLTIVPGRPTCSVDRPLGSSDDRLSLSAGGRDLCTGHDKALSITAVKTQRERVVTAVSAAKCLI